MNYKIQRCGLVLLLLGIIAVLSGIILEIAIAAIGGLITCAISVGLLAEDKFFENE